MSLIDECFWKNGPRPGGFYNFPGPQPGAHPMADPYKQTLSPATTGTSVLGVVFDGGVIIACDTLGSYGSLARYRKLSRVLRVNNSTVLGAGGDYADYQFIRTLIEQRVVSDECVGDGFEYTPASLFSWLTRVFYNRRSKFNPLWNNVVIAGMLGEHPFLGIVDKIGVAYEAKSVASGFGAYIAQPLMRDALEKKQGSLTEQEAKDLIQHCMTVLYYRDARSWPTYEIAVVTKDHTAVIEGPIEVKGQWDIAKSVGGYE
jgi:20S proteasome subunit beta 7